MNNLKAKNPENISVVNQLLPALFFYLGETDSRLAITDPAPRKTILRQNACSFYKQSITAYRELSASNPPIHEGIKNLSEIENRISACHLYLFEDGARANSV